MATSNIERYRSSTSSFQNKVYAFAVLLLILISTDFYSIVLSGAGYTGKLSFFTLVPMLALAMLYYRYLLRAIFASPEIVCLVLLAILSVVWSLTPGNSLERSFSLMVTTGFAMVLGSALSIRGLVYLLAGYGAAVMLLSMLAIVILPEARGQPPWEDTWNGIFNHKNGFGQASLVALLLMLGAQKMTQGNMRLFFKLVSLMALAFLIITESRTAQAIGLITITALFIGLYIERLSLTWAISFLVTVLFLVVGTAILLSTPLADPVFAAIGRKPTLSSRLPLWELVWPYAMNKFWLGYGYYAFWHESSPYYDVISSSEKLGFRPFYSHNGFIETWLHVGFAGIVIVVLMIFRTFKEFFFCLRHLEDRKALIVQYAAMMMFLLGNLTEGSLMSRSHFMWIIFVAVAVNINCASRDLRRGARKAAQRK